ncbi:hypothetical protein FN846DRAFT_904677 [Sphaerosporella brunnea]|uniref:TM7S3/TM198-like domain-containing protein n=1 Tax=Sphaerosporella brunnea TaxID=1250544 RepID=A0A5J5F3I1_9PEZI|nr:hypothetical protein FN846DRAFT_904677 [Sphaerosporella brunnea]
MFKALLKQNLPLQTIALRQHRLRLLQQRPLVLGSSQTTAIPMVVNNTQKEVYHGGLPLKPRLTPGLCVAGIILMIAGMCSCLIGIKIKRLQIFLSSAYLAGLATTVLIVYVMNPPITNAIQGAYVVAVVITGSVVGGLAIIFPEVTEGLGCLLGGFCLSMWFLVLKPGGLLTSVYGKLIMIGVFCCAVSAFAFHRVTRPWGLIASLAFAGSTSLVLGIDCYSRAGLKEFWIYIWSLNNDLFPLGTNTYPQTRGMKVEIAAIIIIFAIGVMSQIKLWKILQERRDAKDAQRRQYEADLEAIDEETGRRVEAEYQAEKSEWEKIYGDGAKSQVSSTTRPASGESKTDSGLGDDEIKECGGASRDLETGEMKGAGAADIPGSGTPGEISNSGDLKRSISSASVSRKNLAEVFRRQSVLSTTSAKRASRHSITDELGQIVDKESLHDRADLPSPPTFVPLPVPIPHEEDEDAKSDASSVGAAADSAHYSVLQEHEGLQALQLRLPYNADNRLSMASSVAATCDDQLVVDDDLPELNRFSTTSSLGHPVEPTKDDENTGKPSTEAIEAGSEKLPVTTTEEKSKSEEDQRIAHDDPKAGKRASIESSQSLEKLSTGDGESTITPASSPPASSKVERIISPLPVLPQDLVPASYPKSKPSSTDSRGSTFEVQTCSKVVKTFRTNEWAKHLAEAEKPEFDDLVAVGQETECPDEQPARLDIQDLLGTASKPGSRNEARKSIRNTPSPVSATPLKRASHRSSSNAAPLPLHSEAPNIEQSTPSPPPVAAEQTPAIPLIDRATSVADKFPTQNTLLGQRETIVRNRASYIALGARDNQPTSSPALPWNPAEAHRSASAMSVAHNSRTPTPSRAPMPRQPSSQMLSDDMPLASRQQLLHQSMSQQALSRNSWNPHPQQQSRRGTPMPQQMLPDKHAELLSTWRDGKRADQQLRETTNTVDQRRAEMLNERNRAVMAERQKAMQENFNGGLMEERMRQRDMQELHREAMHKMQARANKNVR